MNLCKTGNSFQRVSKRVFERRTVISQQDTQDGQLIYLHLFSLCLKFYKHECPTPPFLSASPICAITNTISTTPITFVVTTSMYKLTVSFKLKTRDFHAHLAYLALFETKLLNFCRSKTNIKSSTLQERFHLTQIRKSIQKRFYLTQEIISIPTDFRLFGK